jgi:hypothetical protein
LAQRTVRDDSENGIAAQFAPHGNLPIERCEVPQERLAELAYGQAVTFFCRQLPCVMRELGKRRLAALDLGLQQFGSPAQGRLPARVRSEVPDETRHRRRRGAKHARRAGGRGAGR